MSDKKVLIFGSFTEDETILFHGKGDDNNVYPFEMRGLQFGSLDLNTLSSIKGLGSGFKQTSSTKTKDFSAADMKKNKSNVDEAATVKAAKQSKELESNSKKNKVDEAVSVQAAKHSEKLDSNATTNGCAAINGEDAITNERIHKGMNSLKICEEDGTCSKDLSSSKVQNYGLEMFNNSNGLLRDALAVKDAENKQESNKHAPMFRGLLPRGLINLGNLCFLNSTLQALLSCSPFVELLLDLKTRNVPKIGYPTLHAFVDLISEFCLPDDSSLENGREIVGGGRPFSPIMFDSVLKKFTPDVQSGVSARPRQEDAQEFLSFLMDQMHDELLRLGGHLSLSNGGSSSLISASDDDEGWETIGPKNKSAITRTQTFMPSELSAIFGGQLRSVVKARGNKASATVQPFLLLHLDILPEAIHTIEDALRFFSAPETLEGYRASSGKAGLVNASKSVKIQTLSKIVILHLMRFSYGMRGSSKLNKPIHFPLEFVMGRDLLLTPSTEGRKYELVATITHHGRGHSKGHYTADCRYSNGRWLRYDDSSITAVGLNKVLHDQAYVLFYKQV